jgi:hypothetical protein
LDRREDRQIDARAIEEALSHKRPVAVGLRSRPYQWACARARHTCRTLRVERGEQIDIGIARGGIIDRVRGVSIEEQAEIVAELFESCDCSTTLQIATRFSPLAIKSKGQRNSITFASGD